MSKEKELDPTLKAFEAELASLVPRTDRLDRERLIFLAGQQSIGAANIQPATPARRFGWPAAFAAMTTVAAVLAVILLLQPDPQMVVRFVDVPAEPAVVDPTPPETDRPHPAPKTPLPDSEHIERPPDPLPTVPRPGGWSLWASLGLPRFPDSDQGRWGGPLSHPQLIQQILAEGPDFAEQPRTITPRSAQPVTTSVPYRELLERLLNDQARTGAPPSWPASKTSIHSGANS